MSTPDPATSPASTGAPSGGPPTPSPSSPTPAAPTNVNAAPSGKVSVAATITTPAFPPAYTDPLAPPDPNSSLGRALSGAITGAGSLATRVAFCVVALDSGPPYPTAMSGNADGVEFFGASLLKVAAMYTLFELRQRLRLIAKELGTSIKAADFLTRAGAHLNPQYIDWARKAKAMSAGIKSEHAKPILDQAFACTDGAGSVSIDFLPALTSPIVYGAFDADGNPTITGGGLVRRMIVWSQTSASTQCVRRCGYGAINGMLESAGLFSRGDQTGIWLAGDYEEAPFTAQKYPAFKIPSNDEDKSAAQAMTTVQMARLFALMFKGDLFADAAASAEMMTYLEGDKSAPVKPGRARPAGPQETWMNRVPTMPDGTPCNYSVVRGKLGVGPSGGKDLFSETSMLMHTSSGKQFIYSWVNFRADPKATDDKVIFLPVTQVAHQTFATYVSSPPPPTPSPPSTPPPPTQPSPTRP